MKSLHTYLINEKKGNDTAMRPFDSKEELMEFIEEVEKTKLIVKKYEDEADKVWNEMQKAQKQAKRLMFKCLKILPKKLEI